MDHEQIIHAKSELRFKKRAARRAITPELRASASQLVAARLVALAELADARAVLAYGAMPEELDLDPALDALRERGVRIALPRMVSLRELTLHWERPDGALATGPLGLREPLPDAPLADPSQLDAVLTPGVAFDAEGWRLGMGCGYYDVLFSRLGRSVARIGIAYDEQLADAVPHEATDQPMDVIVTPSRVLRPAGSATSAL